MVQVDYTRVVHFAAEYVRQVTGLVVVFWAAEHSHLVEVAKFTTVLSLLVEWADLVEID